MLKAIFYKHNKLKSVLTILFLAFYIIGFSLSGGNILELGLFLLSCLVFLFLPGFFIYKFLNIEKYIKNFSLPIIFTLGSGFLVCLYCVIIRLNLSILYIIPILMAGISGVIIYKNKQEYKNYDTKKDTFLLFFYSGLIMVYTFTSVFKYARPTTAGEIILSQDFLWNVGNANSFSLGFPPQDIRFFNVRLQYHYFTELLTSALGSVCGVSNYNIIAFYSQSVFLLVLIYTLFLFGKKIYNNNDVKSNILTISLFVFSCLSLVAILPNGVSLFSNTVVIALLTNINSMANALIFVIVFSSLFYNLERLSFKANFGYYLTLIGSFILLIFTKSPIAAILAIAIFVSLFARFLQLKFSNKEIIFSLFISGVFALIYFVNFSSGTNSSTGFSTFVTLELGPFKEFLAPRISSENLGVFHIATVAVFIIVQTFCIAPFTMPIFVKSAFKSLFEFKKLSFFKLYTYAIAVGGFLAFYLSYHESFSQVYFMYIGLFFLNLIAIDNFEFEKINKKNIVNYSLLFLSLITTLFLYTNLVGSGARQFLFNKDILEKYPYYIVIKDEDELAGEYLNENMQKEELFATNRVFDGRDLLSNVYTAFSGRQCFMEGNKYTISNMGLSDKVADERLLLNSTLFNENSSKEEILEICKTYNITHLLYSNQNEGSYTQLESFNKVFDDGTVKIYQIDF